MVNPQKVEPDSQTNTESAEEGPWTLAATLENLGIDEGRPSPVTASSSTAVNSTQHWSPRPENQTHRVRPRKPPSQGAWHLSKEGPPRSPQISQDLTFQHPEILHPFSPRRRQPPRTSYQSSQPRPPSPSTPGPSRSTLPIIAEEQNRCAICYELFSSRSTLMPCGHDVDFECVLPWLEECYNRHNNVRDIKCPLCRGEIKTVQHDHKPDGNFSTYNVEFSFCPCCRAAPLHGPQSSLPFGYHHAGHHDSPVEVSRWRDNILPPADLSGNLEIQINVLEAIQRHRDNLRIRQAAAQQREQRRRKQEAEQERYRQRQLLESDPSAFSPSAIGMRERLDRIAREDKMQGYLEDYRHIIERERLESRRHHQQMNEELEAMGESASTDLDLRPLRPSLAIGPGERPSNISERASYLSDESESHPSIAGSRTPPRYAQTTFLQRELGDLDNMPTSSPYLEIWQDRMNEIPTGWTKSEFEEVIAAFDVDRDSQQDWEDSED